MAIRREPTYLSTDVWKSCWYLAQSRGRITDDQGLPRTMTADEVANDLLGQVIDEKYPEITEHRKQIKKLESEFVKELGGGK